MPAPADRQAFAERIRLQLQSRYREVEIVIDEAAFALRLKGAGVDVPLPLGPLHHACERAPERAGRLITDPFPPRRTSSRRASSAARIRVRP